MAPIEVIDLTSSPEPENTPAREEALAQFQPRRHKTATVPNGLPFSHGNDSDVDGDDDDDARRNLPQPKDLDSSKRPIGSFAPVTPQESLQHIPKTAGTAVSVKWTHGQTPYDPTHGMPREAFNGMLHRATTMNHNQNSSSTSRSSQMHGARGSSLNGSRASDERPLRPAPSHARPDGHRKQSAPDDRHQSSNGSQFGAAQNGFLEPSTSRQDRLSSAYHTIVDIARPLNGISSESLARVRRHRNDPAVAYSPLGLALQQQELRTQSARDGSVPNPSSAMPMQPQQQGLAEDKRYPCPVAQRFGCSYMFTESKHANRHARIHTGEKNEVCPSCGKKFARRDNMKTHHQRCEARSIAKSSTRFSILAQHSQAPYTGSGLTGDSKKPPAEEPFNVLKRSLPSPTSDYRESPIGTSKRVRVDLTSPKVQQQRPRPKIQLVDMTDPEMDSLVHSDESKDQSQEPTLPEPRLDSPNIADAAVSHSVDDLSSGPSRNGLPYSAEEDTLLKKLKEVSGLPWHLMPSRFSGRTQGSLQFHYSGLHRKDIQQSSPFTALEPSSLVPAKRIRKSNVASGMVSWASVKKAQMEETQTVETQREKHRRKHLREQGMSELEAEVADDSPPEAENTSPKSPSRDNSYPSSMSRILRLRELGVHGRRAWSGKPHPISDELKDHVFSEYGLHSEYQGTSGDVISLAWNDCGRFAASSIAIADQQSMQYNMHRNLLVGDTNRRELEEVLHHHVPRPVVEGDNVNASHAMRESQDPRLFLTVTAARFCPQDGRRLYTAAKDHTLRCFGVEQDRVAHQYAIKHTSPVDLLSIGSGHGLVATGSHQPTENINVFQCDSERYEVKMQMSLKQSTNPIFPSALRWGSAPQHRNLLLAGFSGEEETLTTGDTCLWDVSAEKRIHLGGVSQNVFDVAWNPVPSSSSIAFAVAGNATGHIVDKGMRSVIQCFAAGQNGARSVLTWQCPALDINDLVFCPYDDHLIAAGATNGRVYIWDKRSADRSQRPLHKLKHEESLNVLDHDRDAELADTGVQFLSWGPTKTRLYSGSSDGIVKIWNPYRSPTNTHIDDISCAARDRSAVMSGAFSPDYQELLIGTENGRINLFKSGSGALHKKPQKFKLLCGPEPEKQQQEPFIAARALLETGQIELKPCGAMPLRQAVQGPNYQGPFLKPSKSERREAKERLDRAILVQAPLGHEDDEADVAKANAEVQTAEDAVADLQNRKAFARIAKPQAKAFQRELAASERTRKELEDLVGGVERCKLDCAVFPQQHEDDEDEMVQDSGRAELRIPGFLRYVSNIAAVIEGDEEDTSPTCPACFPARRNIKGVIQEYCKSSACVLKRARLTSACSRCGKAARPETEKGRLTMCERCEFGCFRCGTTVVISEDSRLMTCGHCSLEWEIGVLGYELVSTASSAPTTKMEIDEVEEDEDDLMQALGDEDREFYAGRWIVPGT